MFFLRRQTVAPDASRSLPPDFTPEEIATWRACHSFTMTSPERLVALTRAIAHVVGQRIPGDIVECGVWKGGSMMAAARTLLQLGESSRALHLFDTFTGMPPPSERDYSPVLKKSAADILAREDPATSHVWAVAGLDEVRANLKSTHYPTDLIRFVPGRVEATLPAAAPEKIALLRLDTDWYESTLHELIHLFPRLVAGGILIVDDYGHWQGARQAVDQYLAEHRLPLLLCRIDYTGRIAVKP